MKQVTVLLSGGIDSTACVQYYLGLNYCVSGLFVDYGQTSLVNEKLAVSKVSKYYGITTNQLILPDMNVNNQGVIQGRNLLLLSVAYFNFTSNYGIIALGIHSGTLYPDCSQDFIIKMQSIMDLYTDGRIVIDCPFLHFNKREIFEYCVYNKIPMELTYSCEMGLEQPCGKCSSCQDIIKFYETKDQQN